MLRDKIKKMIKKNNKKNKSRIRQKIKWNKMFCNEIKKINLKKT